MDHLTPNERSLNMSKIRSENTKPERIVRSLLHSMGYRFRLHIKDLPGKPDIVLKKLNTIFLVNGCFWHNHKNCKRSNIPKSNQEYWKIKIQKNIARDKRNIDELQKMGWRVIVIWECQTKNTEKIQ